eukprot:13873159-Alexandrium_andersonii.AAC.1
MEWASPDMRPADTPAKFMTNSSSRQSARAAAGPFPRACTPVDRRRGHKVARDGAARRAGNGKQH